MSDLISSNKRIAKNTIALYIRLIVTIIVNFVAARLVLDALGASDFGLYNVVGGVVAMLNVLGISMVSTSYRYIAVEIGKGNEGDPNKVYNTVLVVHIILAVFVLIIGETLGVYYVNNYLNVALDKIADSLFVLHFSLITCAISIITVPVNGLLIAREKFIFTSIVDAFYYVIKLGCVIGLLYIDSEKLRYYAIMMAVCQLIVPLVFQLYCRKHDAKVVKWNFNRNWSDYKDVLSFAFWILIGALSSIAKNQGAALVINFFFGTVINASFAIAGQINSATSQFTSTLRQAVVPQIMKGHTSGEESRSIDLVYRVSRYSYMLMLIPAVAIIICVDGILKLWLGNVLEYTDSFVVLMLINGMIVNLCAGFDALIQASGKIRNNQIGFSLINLSLIPIIFVLYKLGFPPYVNVVTMIVLSFGILFFQCGIMKSLSSFNIPRYIKVTIIPSIITTATAFAPLFFIKSWCNRDIPNTIIGLIICVLWSAFTVYMLGIDRSERTIIKNFLRNKVFHNR